MAARADHGPSVGHALRTAAARLGAAGSPSPRLDAELLLGHVTGRDRAWLLAHPEAPIADPGAFEALVERRAAGEPVAYIRGFKEWHSLRLATDARALIPRPETELLADAAADEVERRLSARERVTAWDVGTGSGAVALVLALRVGGRAKLIASDVSTDALALAAENLSAHGVREHVELVEADLLERAGSERPRPDVVVANLPYVSSAEVDARAGSLGFEPRVAVDGGPDGLAVLRRLFAQLPDAAAKGASVYLELGVGQAGTVARLAPAGTSVRIVPDLAGLDRVVELRMPD